MLLLMAKQVRFRCAQNATVQTLREMKMNKPPIPQPKAVYPSKLKKGAFFKHKDEIYQRDSGTVVGCAQQLTGENAGQNFYLLDWKNKVEPIKVLISEVQK